jgi:hypothetical protein
LRGWQALLQFCEPPSRAVIQKESFSALGKASERILSGQEFIDYFFDQENEVGFIE